MAAAEEVARRALALYADDPRVAEPGAVPELHHLFNRLEVVTEWRGALHDSYRFAAEALIAIGAAEGQGLPLANVFANETALGIVGRATELYAASGWRTGLRAPGGRWAELSVARMHAAEHDVAAATGLLFGFMGRPDVPDTVGYLLAAWAGGFAVEAGEWNLAEQAAGRLEEIVVTMQPPPSEHQLAEMWLLQAEIAVARSDLAAARELAERVTAGTHPACSARMAVRLAMLRAAVALATGHAEAAVGILAGAEAAFESIHDDLRPRFERLRREALEQVGDHRALSACLKRSIGTYMRPRERSAAVEVLGGDLSNQLDAVFDELHDLLVGHVEWERSEVVEAITHDLAGALTIVRLAVAQIDAGQIDTDRSRVAEALHAATGRMRAIVDTFSLLVSIERRRLRPALTPHRLGSLVARVVANMRPIADAKSMPIVVECGPAADVSVLADVGFFEMSLSNVITNAVKYSQPGSSIVVRLTRDTDAGQVGVSVVDTGPGLVADELESIFDRHVRGRARPTGAEPSLGLGLYISRAMCGLMGGRIEAASDGDGCGATFTMVLPEAWAGEHRMTAGTG